MKKGGYPTRIQGRSIIHLYKRKGNAQVCDNHRGTSLFSIAGKILAKFLLNRLNEHLDLRKLVWIMAKFGCPAKFIAVMQQFHEVMFARVFSEPFPVNRGGILAPTPFSMMFSAMLTDAFQDCDAGIPIRYHFDGKLFNLRRLQAKSKVQTHVLDGLLYVDDMTKNAKTEREMQEAMDRFSQAFDNYDLTISTKTFEVVYQPALGERYIEPTITVTGQRPQVVDKFTYL